ncbi:MAG: sulfatase [Rhodocyclaceae bacterium]|nr:sulfatase [Rhodocyclaceae bacterium]
MGALGVAASLMLDTEPMAASVAGTKLGRRASGPSVVLVILDSVRADHLSLYGYQRDTTPFLRRLASVATLYENAFSTSDTSIGSHASIFTGMYPSWHGAHYAPPEHPYGRSLDPGIPTLASILSERGYRTMSIAANNAYLSDGFGLTRGFQLRDARALLPLNWPEDFGRSFLRWILSGFADTAETDRLFRRAEELNAQISALLAEATGKGPLLLVVNYMDAHHPYVPPPPYDRVFPGKDRRYTYRAYQTAWNDINSQRRAITARERRHLISQYDGGIAYLDHQIGLLVHDLREKGLYEDTMLIVTSDHGEAFGEKGLLEHGVSVYQNLVHVPLLIKYPGQKQGLRVREPVSGADLMPTALARAGCPIPPNVQGRDLLGNGPGRLHFVLSESFPRTAGFVGTKCTRFERTERAVISGNMKLIVSTTGRKELYDLAADPAEERDLYRAGHPVARELEARLREALQTLPRRQAQPSRLDVERLRQLKSLGYIR